MKSKLAFVGRFLLIFAVLVVLGGVTEAPAYYAELLKDAAAFASPLTNGWWLETRVHPSGADQLWFRHGEMELRLLLSLERLALGLLPLLSLLGATPRLGLKRLGLSVSVGGLALFGLDLAVLLLYPILVGKPNALTDIVGTFLGLLIFVGAPVILWFVLTYDRLQPVWGLGLHGHRASTSAGAKRRSPARRHS